VDSLPWHRSQVILNMFRLLWRTVMPGYRTHAVHKPQAHGFKIDLAMDGFVFLMGVAPGREFEKQDVARLLGYKGQNAWKENQNRIRYLLDPFFGDGTTNRKDNMGWSDWEEFRRLTPNDKTNLQEQK
jgi:hypothetical protein